jgi:hypothetical protein
MVTVTVTVRSGAWPGTAQPQAADSEAERPAAGAPVTVNDSGVRQDSASTDVEIAGCNMNPSVNIESCKKL